ncbi:bifunctional 5,10-methylenetetrahydrofolate dehydrogenase/5,10-methenyltetrahydrofolate cyclohydrolase [Alkalibacillus almallahensis]|uniref:bifunctional 5,10-methylenetetrahydrofolate dehydrogenase/5,10-methenyltetrahydrofolate cyclohydrolase n=1 Tax=Alkalibacillus almallahensis TaxID=1379154 RepID=UPI001420BE9D|nr:tetrahydrofolate dehydrogenase/cyclohydrolase catalytic domain-containing protein [Alkalibacillus almallahensis]NIK12409.1 methylenetetrahydrofolate dehydrogenase (NADP+)/methenyltetrahydrofolate cyclohydrolase [Alkalibacillus almallahensis]
METTVMYGKPAADQIRLALQEEVTSLSEQQVIPKITVIIIGEHKASQTYVRIKKKAAEKIGIKAEIIEKDETITERELLELIQSLNNDHDTHGILVQLPLPDHIRDHAVLETISPEKDVDGFHPINIGRLAVEEDAFYPCTPLGIMKLLDYYNIDIAQKHVVVVGRSHIVGKPIGQMMLNRDATVTYCHSKTPNLSQYTTQGDILIVAAGRAHLIQKEDVKPGSVVVDVGNSFQSTGEVLGDVDFDDVQEHVSYITPVPKGVGPMTITMLLNNTVEAAKRLSFKGD